MDASHTSAALVQLHHLWCAANQSSQAVLSYVHALERRLCAQAAALLDPGFGAGDLASTIHSIASLPVLASVVPVVDALVAAAQLQLPGFSSQELANTAWAVAKLVSKPPTLLVSSLMAAALPLLPSFTHADLANMVWALATLGTSCPDFVDALMTAAQPHLACFTPSS